MKVTNNIRKYRDRKKWTQSKLADELGVKRISICRWEAGQSQPREKRWTAIAAVLDTTEKKLFIQDW